MKFGIKNRQLMCDTCGCGEPGKDVTIRMPGEEQGQQHSHSHDHLHSHDDNEHTHEHVHSHTHTELHSHDYDHDHPHHHHDASHDHSHGREVKVEQDILQKNSLLAERNRGFFEAREMVALNLVSSPGSGKTSLLEKTIKELGKKIPLFIIEGDQQTMHDANRIKEAGAPVVQINTGNGCHLDADMVNRAVKKLQPVEKSVLFIENVGNLVCPSLFDLGEQFRVVIMSVTEGDDKPVKYPTMFHSSQICIINKTDLLPYVDFDMEKARNYALQVNHHLKFFELSVKTGEGMDMWFKWIETLLTKKS